MLNGAYVMDFATYQQHARAGGAVLQDENNANMLYELLASDHEQ